MAKTRAKRKRDADEITMSNAGSRWLILPPEILRMILQYLATDKETLRACSQTAQEFRHVALSFFGRHLSVNDANRVKECAQLITRGAFQHVRSLDLGVVKKSATLEENWKHYIVILGSFARFRTLGRLWLSEVPFTFLQKNNLRETITLLGSAVTELGLYGCHFSSYEEMISFIRTFPLCNFLFIRDCVTGGEAIGGNALAGLPEHKLVVQDLQLSASSSRNLLIDVSNLIKDADLDIGSLTSLVCDVGTSERTQCVAAAVSTSPVKHFQLACSEPGGFQVFVNHLSKWSLKTLTIGPQFRETNTVFWVEAFKGLPPLPLVNNVTVVYHYPKYGDFNIDFWEYLERILSRRDLFPALKSMHVRCSFGSHRLERMLRWQLDRSLRSIKTRGITVARQAI
ncbi:hypothetical protein BJ322DRAFT_1086751 [Thelephora terrestris]|uniref:F-box domain-containing protein n=1 Tax=Thelephora terrestris TaxID=56493 RepID=A0A9P6H7L1_9AGAM|nr:hypothetical protein BJ322DRAFT_1086751 [Thelephora terrestris]